MAASQRDQAKSSSQHLLLVLVAAVSALAPLYWIDGARTLRPSRVLGPLGIPSATVAEQDLAQAPAQTSPPAAPATKAASSAPLRAQAAPAQEQARQGAKLEPAAAPKSPPSPPEQTAKAPSAGASSPSTGTSTSAPNSPAGARTPPLLAIEGAEHLKSFYSTLARGERTGPVRVLHYGDSTLAGDGVAKTVRQRMKAQFGDGGPGFVVAGMDPRWMRRDDVRVSRSGEWEVFTILNGGNQGRYGLGGIVAKARGATQVQIAPAKSGQALGQRLEIYAQKSRRPEALRLQINGAAAAPRRIEHGQFDQWVVDSEADIVSTALQVQENGLEVYGLVLEAQSGITWETTAVVGIASGSIRQFNADHLAEQTRARRPDLIVVMLGGNDTGNGNILVGDGKLYREGFIKAVQVLRQGAPQAACLIMSPLDQGTLGDDGRIYSKRTLARMVALQRQASQDMGCAFWNSWEFMGGQNSFARWLDQGLAWTDLMHLTERGLNRIGQGLSDALLQGYEQHRRGQ